MNTVLTEPGHTVYDPACLPSTAFVIQFILSSVRTLLAKCLVACQNIGSGKLSEFLEHIWWNPTVYKDQ
jgi:hypothetical protein